MSIQDRAGDIPSLKSMKYSPYIQIGPSGWKATVRAPDPLEQFALGGEERSAMTAEALRAALATP
jgi:hypothetical protein